MRIACISAHTSPLAAPGGRDAGGMNVYVLESARTLAGLGYELDIFTRRDDDDSPQVQQVAPGVRLVRIDAGPAQPLTKIEIFRCLEQFGDGVLAFAGNDARYDLVHAHYWMSGVAGLRLREIWGVPLVAMFHTLGEVKNRARITEAETPLRIAAEREIAAAADRVVTASEHEAQLLERLYGAPRDRLVEIPCGIDLELFRPRGQSDARKRLGLHPARPLVLYVGRIERLKGIDVLIEAVQQMDDLDFELAIVGGDEAAGELTAELSALAERLGVAQRIRWVGAVEHDELPWWYSAAEVCVVPSYYESFGLVAVEAMACGTPVVASRVGGLAYTVRDHETGYLIPWRCPEPFVEGLEVILKNGQLRRNFGLAARASVQRFGWPVVGRQLAALYESLAGQRANGLAAEAFETAVLSSGPRAGRS
jgi:D-inositol-3-phosphate glycosyltransferase